MFQKICIRLPRCSTKTETRENISFISPNKYHETLFQRKYAITTERRLNEWIPDCALKKGVVEVQMSVCVLSDVPSQNRHRLTKLQTLGPEVMKKKRTLAD